jgi:hypothetical protein
MARLSRTSSPVRLMNAELRVKGNQLREFLCLFEFSPYATQTRLRALVAAGRVQGSSTSAPGGWRACCCGSRGRQQAPGERVG